MVRCRPSWHELCALLTLGLFITVRYTECLPTPTASSETLTSTAGTAETSATTATSATAAITNSSAEQDADELDSDASDTQALLDYENSTIVDKLEEQVQTLPDPSVEIPPNVYEVSLFNWVEEEEEEESNPRGLRNLEVESRAQTAMRNSLQEQEPAAHQIRHRESHRLPEGRSAVGRRTSDNEPVINLPIENLSDDLINILRSRSNLPQENSGSLRVLEERDRFNMTVDYQAPFRNIEASKLLEIILLMRSDCSLLPQRIVRWVSGKRGILFECKNGAWVVRYLKRVRRRPRPENIIDCHEIHMAGSLGEAGTEHKAIITFSNKEMKSYDILCKHDSKHLNHQLIDNHINTDIQATQPQGSLRSGSGESAGAWTVVQRRQTGGLKFYRAFRRYKKGFGKLSDGEYWLGLEALHEMTHLRPYMLRVEITTHDNKTYFSEYSRIRVASETKKYRLKLGHYIKPTAEDLEFSAGDFMSLHNRGTFHARDMEDYSVNCARLYGTGFWFRGCWAAVNLNGPYETLDWSQRGVRWATSNPEEDQRVWKTEMLIKPIF